MAKSRKFGGPTVIVIALIAVGAGVWYYLKDRDGHAPEFATTRVTRGEITQAVTATGDLQPVLTVDVGAQVSGQIREVLVDFNSKVKSGQVLAKIDPSMADQRLRQAEADLASAKASGQLAKITAERTRELFAKNLVSQSDLDTAQAQLAQADATLMTRTAAVENARLDLDHCTITSPIDGIVLNRNTDPGRTVNSNMNAPTLFTLVNDLSKMQINAAVAEADVGSIEPGQDVTFTVDAFPNRTFRGTVRQVRDAATTDQNVVSYATIIDVNNRDLKLRPGMTANVSVIIARKREVLRVGNAALRARIPQELLPKIPEPPGKTAAPSHPTLSPQERRAAFRSVMTEAGIQFGTPPTPAQVEKAKKLAQDKGLDPEMLQRFFDRMAQFGGRAGGRGGFDRGGSGGEDTVVSRTLYKLVTAADGSRQIVPAQVRLGISDGINTEVVSGLAPDDDLVTSVTLPGENADTGSFRGGPRNPFQGGPRFGPFRR